MEMEIRTPSLGLQMCKMVMNSQGEILLNVKQGKRIDYIPLDLLNEMASELRKNQII